ncbi:hypothetical protein AMES_6098 [Amycolatopsis mediterranei S699]|uniref:PE domain-containing protein n=2 Tax=Amycolatopsis mediterranei TaxID=33910 RepID=A0A0H3DCZ5_AMYMU|nr:hypothetical protein [Amycolatopsis mediterranei]ADJ47923.1 hypothetical protein AMED_6188 [Amycolatopsis mediterranei U32]AEK44822.1 hypothetical protein RAM_31745 [Amycolatopsis mediterranei S699]AFO79634.1 hypothetical protein AMES_6098 [Amycolatopsis mediterranei S699]AGT86762.1 hypothetical protein B737_6098 [Amycolatopsis mediterranei RB]KDO10744.1 hypothetical protein DV26_10995 [Amycolatopsis mediterranei]
MAQSHTGVDPWLAGVDVEIRNTGGTEPSAASGAGFSLSVTEANAVLAQAQNALAKLVELRQQTGYLKQVRPAAHDPASIAYNARLVNGRGVFDTARDHVDAEVRYLGRLIEKVEQALRTTSGYESEAAHDLAATPRGGVAG